MEDLDDRLREAAQAEADARFVDALKAYRSALQVEARCVPALLGVGRIALVLGKSKQALESFTSALVLDPNTIEGLRGRGLAWFNHGLHDKAMKDLNRAVDLAPESVEPRLSRAIVSMDLELFELAEIDLVTAHRLSPSDPDVAVELAFCKLCSLGTLPSKEALQSTLPGVETLLKRGRAQLEDDPLIVLLEAETLHLQGDEHAARHKLILALNAEPELRDRTELLPRCGTLLGQMADL